MYISNIDKEDNVYMGNEYKKIISDKKIEAGRLMSNKQVSDCNIAIHTASAAAAAAGWSYSAPRSRCSPDICGTISDGVCTWQNI